MIQNEKKAKRNGYILAGSLWAGVVLGGFFVYNSAFKTPELNYKKLKEPIVQVQSSTSQSQKNKFQAQEKPSQDINSSQPLNQAPLQNNQNAPAQLKQNLEKIVKPQTKINHLQHSQVYDAGVVVCSNQNLLYAQLNLDMLKTNKYADSFLQKVKVDGTAYYRTIVGTTSQNLEAKLRELQGKNFFDIADQYFTVKGKEIIDLSKESGAVKELRVQNMQNEFRNIIESATQAKYTTLMTPFIDEAHNLYTQGGRISGDKIKEIAGYMYAAAKEFKVPLLDFTAIIANESKFTNQKGDLWSKKNYSEGYPQIRRQTQQFIFNKMKQEKIKDLPDKLPGSILPYPELQFRMAAWYLNYCFRTSGWRDKDVLPTDNSVISKAVQKYNAGHASDMKNTKYENRVSGEKTKMISYAPSAL